MASERIITLRVNFDGPTRHYKTLAGAQRGMHRLLGDCVRRDPDGYLVGRHGDCLFVIGATLDEMMGVDDG